MPWDRAPASLPAAPPRLRLHVQGTVQGVGFRPFCLQQAQRLALSGWVRNDADGLWCEVQGAVEALEAFVDAVTRAPPPLARVERSSRQWIASVEDAQGFHIAESRQSVALATGLPPDSGVCAQCLRELFDPADRRYRYPFINCTQCGPRFTLVHDLPYDRPQTSMAGFTQCAACTAEYTHPGDRRHHAQPNACPDCGPALSFHDAQGQRLACGDPLESAVAALRAGQILAVRGVGGFHLVCDAHQAETLALLRARKQRPGKPFAVLALNATSLRQWLRLDEDAQTLLESPARPVVLLPRRSDVSDNSAGLDAAIAPGLNEWGALLPAHPLHWLLFHEWLGRPSGDDWMQRSHPALFVCTSANPSGEPLVMGNDEAFERLRGIADGFLVHNREIVARCDDSIRRPMGRDPAGRLHAPFVRRARGYVPDPILVQGIPADAAPVLAAGGWLKNTVCITRGNEAFLSAHLGDLGSAASCAAWGEAVQRLLRFLGVRPQAVAHDLHPDFHSTRAAQALAAEWGLPALGIGHHAAHLAAVRAEYACSASDHRETLHHGLVMDGTGLGEDGGLWGGEWLALSVDGHTQRLGQLHTLALPGGDAAAREPWRVAAAALYRIGLGSEINQRFRRQPGAGVIARMLTAGLNCPPTSSAGRAFDAAAALLGLCERNDHEADAAMRLEACASRAQQAGTPQRTLPSTPGSLDALWRHLATIDSDDAEQQGAAALLAHHSIADALFDTLLRAGPPPAELVLSGGCMINRLLRARLLERCAQAGIRPLEARRAPPGDGGLALGQAWIVLRRIAAGTLTENH